MRYRWIGVAGICFSAAALLACGDGSGGDNNSNQNGNENTNTNVNTNTNDNTSCGDGVCEAGESCASCPGDCGLCPTRCDLSGPDAGEDCASCGTTCTAYWVSTLGDDGNDGSQANPWATIGHALQMIPASGGQTVCVEDGVYRENIDIETEFANPVWVKAVNPYQAILTADHNPVLDISATHLSFGGFEVVGDPGTNETGGLIYLYGAEYITFRNNIIHDTYDNDLIRVLQSHHTTWECNVLYNQAEEEEHFDINGGSRETVIQDNIFFNDYAASGRSLTAPVQCLIVIKNSSGAVPTTGAVYIRRNIFMHYEGGGHPHLRIGADGEQYCEAEDIVVENNLFLYNGADMNGAFTVLSARNVTFRANTFVGNATDDPFAGRVGTGEGSPPSEAVFFYNNVFSRPDGLMAELIESPSAEVTSGALLRNLYWNGGNEIPLIGDFFDYTLDSSSLVADPLIADPAAAVCPVFDGNQFGGQWPIVRAAFEAIARTYGMPGAGSPVIDAADQAEAPLDDLLGQPRDTAPDLGALEVGAGGP